ncbi:MAG TPA: histidinol-phosphate transaminase [Burkholderiaceae bacterium]|nr:histidinol-phosphate transaminase [Burkholderiaceae bacterium]
MNPCRYWSPQVAALTPYVPGEQPATGGLIKLNTNENPFGPAPSVLAAIRAAATDDLRLYPDPDALALRRALAARHGLSADRVFVGNGSDEVLAFVFRALMQPARPVLHPDVSYSFYPVYCRLFELASRIVPLADDFTLRPADYRPSNGGIVFANPNAPTGRLLPLAAIDAIAGANPDSVVVVDEAYIDFGGDTAIPLTTRHPNLLVVQTMSKSRSLAGLRVGHAFGDPALIDGLQRVKNSFNSYPLDRLALAGALAALADEAHFEQTRAQVIASRQWLTAALTGLGFEVLPSAANFVFARHPRHDGAVLQAALRERRILVRHFRQPRIDPFLRISIGTREQCEALIAALEAFLE